MMKNNYVMSQEEKTELFRALLIQEVGYKKAQDLYGAACENYNPIEYAVKKANKELETRDAVYNKKKSMS